MNIIHIAGNLGADPVSRFTASGQKVTSFTVAVNSKRGENVITTWYRVTVWGDRLDKMLGYLKKGSSVIVVGELQKPEIYTDKEGRPQIRLEIWAEILRFSPFGKPAERPAQEQSSYNNNNSAPQGGFEGSFGEPAFAGGGQQGQGQQQHQEVEEELPF